jgi:hypothetical protein
MTNAQKNEENQNVVNLQRENTEDIPFDKEVDELVAWTSKLDEDNL